jgi:hypothetical protein
VQRAHWVDRLGQAAMRRPVAEHERYDVALADLEARDCLQALTVNRHESAQRDHIRPGDRADARRLVEPRDPRHRRAVVEAQRELHRHRHAPAAADDQTHEVALLHAHRHEVDHADLTLRGLELGLEDQRVRTVGAPRGNECGGRRDAPTATLRCAEERSEACRRVEARPAQPVDRAVAADERRTVAVADQGVVFNLQRGSPSSLAVIVPPVRVDAAERDMVLQDYAPAIPCE